MRNTTTTFRAVIAAIASSCRFTPEENTAYVQELVSELTGFHLRNGCDYPLYKYARKVQEQLLDSEEPSPDLERLVAAASIALFAEDKKLTYSHGLMADAFDVLAWAGDDPAPECVLEALEAFDLVFVRESDDAAEEVKAT